MCNDQVNRALVVKLPPYSDESLVGYLIRLSEENGYESPSVVLGVAGCDVQHMRSSKIQTELLYGVLGGRYEQELRLIAYNHDEMQDSRFFKLNGQYVHSMHMRTKAVSICPECVIKYGYIHVYYDVKYAVACPEHRRYTIRVCPRCGKCLTNKRPGLLLCKCGRDLSGERGDVVEDSNTLALLHYLYGRLSSSGLMKVPSVKNLPLKNLDVLELNVLLGLILRLGRASTNELWNQEGVLSAVEAASLALSNWPNGLYQYLEKYHGNSEVEQESLGFRKQFSRFYNWMTKSNLPSDKVGFIVDTLNEFGMSYWKRSAKRSGKNKPEVPVEGDMVGITAAAKYMNVQPQTVRKLVNEGVITPVATTKKRSGELLIELSDDLPRKVNYGVTITAREAAKSIGVPVNVLFSLRRLGVYRVRRIAGKVNSFHEDDVEEFKVKLFEAVTPASRRLHEYEDSMSLSEAMLMKTGSPDSKAYIIDGIINGRIKCALGSEVAFTEMRLLRADVVKAVKDAQEFIDGYVTKVRAAEMLGCDVAVIRWLLDHGYLAEKDYSSTLRVSVASINGFKDEYVACAVLAKQLHTNTRRVERRCQELLLSLLYAKREHIHSYQPFLVTADAPKLKQLWL